MEKVTGIGGFFFRAKDSKALADWYATHLGIGAPPYGLWDQEAGQTVFAPFSAQTDYFGRDTQQWMLNLRVADLDAMIAQLQAAGIAVETREDWDSPETGRFARIHDPEGNPLELWQPA
jgi:glyoxylase I family protein